MDKPIKPSTSRRKSASRKELRPFQDAGSPVDVINRLKRRADAGTLPLRLYVMLAVPNSLIATDAGKIRVIGYGDNHVTVRAIKKQIDGALGSRGAWLLEPYSDLPSTSGLARKLRTKSNVPPSLLSPTDISCASRHRRSRQSRSAQCL